MMASGTAAKYVILDRDGTLIVEKNYLSDPEGVELLPGAVEGLRRLAEAGYRFVVITNQSGVGRGYFPLSAVEAVNERLVSLLETEGIRLDGVYVCPHAPDEKCACRKPQIGMIRKAASELGFDVSGCWVVGDKAVDVELGKNAGAKAILVRTGYGASLESSLPVAPDAVADNLAAVADVILGRR